EKVIVVVPPRFVSVLTALKRGDRSGAFLALKKKALGRALLRHWSACGLPTLANRRARELNPHEAHMLPLRLQGTSHRWLAQSSKAIFLLGSPRRAGRPARATDLSDWLSSLVLPSAPRPTTSDTRFRFFTPAPTLRLPPERRPPPARRCPVPVGVPSAST